MIPASFQQIQATPSKLTIQGVAGTITQVYKIKHEQGTYGPYSIQKIQIQDPGSGLQLRVSIFDADELSPSLVGGNFTAAIGINAKGQPAGLYADHYQSPTQGMIHGVKCSKGGTIYVNGQPWSSGGPIQQALQYAPQQPQQPQQQFHNPPQGYAPQPQPPYQAPAQQFHQPPPVAPAPTQPFIPQLGLPSPQVEPKTPLAFLAGQSAAYAMCFEAALRIREQVQNQIELGPGEPLSTTEVKDMATTLYIEGNRKGIFTNMVGSVATPSPEDY